MFRRKTRSEEEKTPLLKKDCRDKALGGAITPVEIAKLYFDLEDKIYGNAFYVYYTAREKTKNKRVCIKIWTCDYERAEFEKTFLKSLTGNQFPKLLPEFDNDALTTHLVMKYFGKKSLFGYAKEKLKKKGQYLCADKVIFFVANIVLAIEKIHGMGYFHGGLVITEMFLDKNKYLKVVNFCQCAKVDPHKQYKWTNENFNEYFPPEMCLGKEYGKPVDIWMLGISAYYLMTYRYPFRRDSKDTSVESKEEFAAKLKPEEIDTSILLPNEVTFIKDLLKKEPSERLTIQQVKEHAFFKSIDFDTIDNQTYRVKCTYWR